MNPSVPDNRPHLFGMRPEDLTGLLRREGVEIRDAEARRVLAHVFSGASGYPVSRPVPRRVEEAVEALTRRAPLEIVDRALDPTDGFLKYLFRLGDGQLVEAVRIPLEREGRFTICLSSQAGCGMGCVFCATGRMGLARNLESWEIIGQFLAVRHEAPGRVTGAVFQGQGEPLHNYDAVIAAGRILSDPCGGRISASAITISTVGLVPGILRLAEERQPWRLIISLTSAIDVRRRALLPVAGAWPIAELSRVARIYQRASGDRITLAWVVLGGINTGIDEVQAIREHFSDLPLRINLIDVNDARPNGFARATPEEFGTFRDLLAELEVPVIRRYSGGVARHAACGMLASMKLGDSESTS